MATWSAFRSLELLKAKQVFSVYRLLSSSNSGNLGVQKSCTKKQDSRLKKKTKKNTRCSTALVVLLLQETHSKIFLGQLVLRFDIGSNGYLGHFEPLY